MAKKFELGSSEYIIQGEAKKHLSEEEFEKQKEMYGKNEYDEDRDLEYEESEDPSKYESKAVITDEAKALIEMRKERQKADQKRGAGILSFIRSLAS